MKKILLTMACLSTLFVACTDTEVVEKGLSSDIVSFGTYMGQSTRAGATTTANFNNFGVSAYYSEIAAWEAGKSSAYCNYMDKDKVTGSSEAGWAYTNPKYWPKSGYVNFWAWSPAESPNITWTAGTGVPSFTYTVKDAVDKQEDLVVALATDEQKEGGNVSLTFSHLLSKIGFSATLADDYSATVNVTSMEVTYKASTVKNKGVYTYNATTNWAAPSGGDSYQAVTSNSLLDSETVALNNSTSTPLNDADNFLMLLPQAAGAEALSAKITYTVTYSDEVVTTNVETIALPEQLWVAGKQYTYNFNISLTDVKFDVVEVTPWGEASVVMIDNEPVAEFAGAPVAVGYAASSTAAYATSGIESIDVINTDDYSVTYAKASGRAISTETGTLTFTAKKTNETTAAIETSIPVTICDVLGNKSEVTFTLKQAPKIDILNGTTSILDQKQTLVYKSDKGLYSVNTTQVNSVNYTIVGVENASQVVITGNTTDFTASATTTELTIAPTASLSTLGDLDKKATVTVTLNDKGGTKIGTYTFNLQQCAKAYLSSGGAAVTALSQNVVFTSKQALHSSTNSYTATGASNVAGAVDGSDFKIGYTSPTLSITAKNSLEAAGNNDKSSNYNVTLTNAAGETTVYAFSLKQYAAAYVTDADGKSIASTKFDVKRRLIGDDSYPVTKTFTPHNGTSTWKDGRVGEGNTFSYENVRYDVSREKMTGVIDISGTTISITTTHKLASGAHADILTVITSTNAIGEKNDETLHFYIHY